jgi:hypothetical protein
MDLDKLLVDLHVISQLKEQDKLGIVNLPGKQNVVIHSGRLWLQGFHRWMEGSSRTLVIEYLRSLVALVERHSEILSIDDPRTKLMRKNLKRALESAVTGLECLATTYADDQNMVAELNVTRQKLIESSSKFLGAHSGE